MESFRTCYLGCVTQSSYTEKWGTPRQAGLVPQATAIITLNNSLSDGAAGAAPLPNVAALAATYSHLIVVFVFHKNNKESIKAKVRPPKSPTDKSGRCALGVFSTRSPHRYNPIGLSIVKVNFFDPLEPASLSVFGGDLLLGTPVLALFGYQKNVHSIWHSRWPDWIPDSFWGGSSRLEIQARSSYAEVYLSLPAFLDVIAIGKAGGSGVPLNLIKGILSQDPRSRHSQRSHPEGLFASQLNNWEVIYRYLKNSSQKVVVQVVKVLDPTTSHLSSCLKGYRARTAGWLSRLLQILPFLKTN